MGLTDKTKFFDESVGLECRVEPVTLFSIVDQYLRRDEGQDFVMGTLMGTVEDGVVRVCSCFAVPYEADDGQISLNIDFHATMLALQQRVEARFRVHDWDWTGTHQRPELWWRLWGW